MAKGRPNKGTGTTGPNEPTVTGYPSYNPCHPASTTPTPAA